MMPSSSNTLGYTDTLRIELSVHSRSGRRIFKVLLTLFMLVMRQEARQELSSYPVCSPMCDGTGFLPAEVSCALPF